MELIKEILAKALENEEANIFFPSLQLNAKEIIESKSYEALNSIKSILENDSLTDFECIEEIVNVFEEKAGGCKYRHDF